MNNSFVILAAGNSTRFKTKIPKQFNKINGIIMLEHSINIALKSKLFSSIVVVFNKSHKKYLKYLKINNVKLIEGGNDRQSSSLNSLKFLRKINPKYVFLHDAARPFFTVKLLKRIYKNIKKNNAVVPYVNLNDSAKIKNGKKILNYKRENFLITQTPQCFNYKLLYKLSIKNKSKITDESSLFINKNLKIKFIKGEFSNIKITNKNNILKNKTSTFYGIGFDIHRLVKYKKLYLGGIKIPFHSGLQGHSDGDVIIHCIIDSLLGAMRKNDIGTLYPSDKNKFKNIRSTKMMKPIIKNLEDNKYVINNLDINLICENPKVSKYRNKILNSLSRLLNVNKSVINLKGKTVEKLGLIGKEKAIACEAIVSIKKYE
tara:strand:+ start:470 stop:1588 length:1119 start_codon:yes stop_codon:yes gene_type:complete